MQGPPFYNAYGILAACLTLLRPTVTVMQCEPTASPLILAAPDFSADEVLIHAGSLLQTRVHPLSLLVLRYARPQGIDLLTAAHVDSLGERGLKGRVNGKICVLGTCRLMTEVGIDCQSLESEAQTLLRGGQETYFLSIGDHLAGLIAIPGTAAD